MNKQLDWKIKLEKIMDKNTTNLTKTGDKDFNPPEIISFDKVVFEKYDATQELKELITLEKHSSYTQGVNETAATIDAKIAFLSLKYPKKIIQIIRDSIREEVKLPDIRQQIVDETVEKVKEIIGEDEEEKVCAGFEFSLVGRERNEFRKQLRQQLETLKEEK